MFTQDYKEMLYELSKNDVRFLIVGAFALAYHGYPRATGDMDIFVAPDKKNAQGVVCALKAFGAPLADVDEEDFAEPGLVFQIGVPPNRIDLMTGISGVDFEECWKGREKSTLEELEFYVIGRHELIKNKRASGREKDLLDVRMLEKLSKKI